MTTLETLLQQVALLLDERRQPWALVGGLAVSVRTQPRFTRDLDLALAVHDDDAAERTVFDLQTLGFRTLTIVEQDETHRLATARLAPPGSSAQGLLLDLLFASSGIETEICEQAQRLEMLPGCTVPVAQLHHLIALKVLARNDRTRPQDASDLRQLILAAKPTDRDAALTALQLIAKRGYARARNLTEAWTRAMDEFGSDR